MATVKLWSDAEVDAAPRLKAVFDDIRAIRKSDFVNNFLVRTWRIPGAATIIRPFF